MPGLVISTATDAFETAFARDSAATLGELRSLGRRTGLPIDVDEGRDARATRWRYRYPRGRVFGVLIHAIGLVKDGSDGANGRPIPSHWPPAPAGVSIADVHRVDLILPDDRVHEDLRDLYMRIAIHGVTPSFHPNVGDPEQAFCLARQPLASWGVGTYLDQCLAMIRWSRDSFSDQDQRNPEAASYFETLLEAWPAELPTHRTELYGGEQWRLF